MPLDLRALVDPSHTALVTQEIQQGVVGEHSALPGLAAGVERVDMLGNVAKLVAAARVASGDNVGLPVGLKGDVTYDPIVQDIVNRMSVKVSSFRQSPEARA